MYKFRENKVVILFSFLFTEFTVSVCVYIFVISPLPYTLNRNVNVDSALLNIFSPYLVVNECVLFILFYFIFAILFIIFVAYFVAYICACVCVCKCHTIILFFSSRDLLCKYRRDYHIKWRWTVCLCMCARLRRISAE